VPHRQPLLEELGAVRHQELDTVGQRRRRIDRPIAIEGALDREREGCRVEVGEAGEMLDTPAMVAIAAEVGSTSPAWIRSRVA
jgi:hypothetical protein